MAVLVCGGAGYIGSHTVHALIQRDEEVIVVDNLQTGHRKAVHPAAIFYEGDIRDATTLDRIFRAHSVDAILHFAANSLVGESMEQPLKYFNNNVYGMQVLLEAMVRHGIKRIVFSSTAAVYGEPEQVPIPEEAPTHPANPYGETKLTMEKMMKWVSLAHGVGYVSLRYFNVAGALEGGSIGEDHHPESHLVPIMLQVPLKQRDKLTIYGDDYPTPDGTCIRDYIHVMDLADAHLKAIDHLCRAAPATQSGIFNLGNGTGFSVKEMLDAARSATGEAIPVTIGPRRPGDPACLVAASDKARATLGWTPKHTDIGSIISSAWVWHKSHPEGFAE